MMQAGRNLTDAEEGFLRDKRPLLMDRDTKYDRAFRSIWKPSGMDPGRLPPHAPNLNACLERVLRSLKEECLERLILSGEGPLRNAVCEFLVHYYSKRNYQRAAQSADPAPLIAEIGNIQGEIACRNRLGGMLGLYSRSCLILAILRTSGCRETTSGRRRFCLKFRKLPNGTYKKLNQGRQPPQRGAVSAGDCIT
jgi:hypothetical protein